MIWTIAKRELITRLRTKAFRISTAVLVLGVVAAGIGVSVFFNSEDEAEEVTIGLSSSVEALAPAFIANDQFDPTIEVTDDPDELIGNGDIDVWFDGEALTWDQFPEPSLDLYVRTTVQQAEFARRAGELSLGPAELGALFSEVPIDEVFLEGDTDEQGIRIATAMASTLGMFFVLQIWGSLLTMGVVEEKSSRVVEVLLSHVSARTLLTGKIFGLGLLALLQMALLIGGIVLGLSLVDGIEVPDGVWRAVPVLLVMFIFGFAFYAAIYAAVGSTVSRQEDAQTAQLPAMLPLFVGYIIAASSVLNGDSPAVTIASFVPFTSPIVMPFRIALVNPPLWQVGLSVLILAVCVPLVLGLAGKIYETSLLKVGSRIPFLEAIRNRAEV